MTMAGRALVHMSSLRACVRIKSTYTTLQLLPGHYLESALSALQAGYTNGVSVALPRLSLHRSIEQTADMVRNIEL